jgi:hypothetical protein
VAKKQSKASRCFSSIVQNKTEVMLIFFNSVTLIFLCVWKSNVKCCWQNAIHCHHSACGPHSLSQHVTECGTDDSITF